MNDQELDKLIDQYINNEMSGHEREAFHELLQEDKSLQEKVHLRGILAEAILHHEEKEIKEVLADVTHHDLQTILAKGNRTKSKIILRVILYAAILTGFIFIMNLNKYKYDPMQLGEQYYTVAPVLEYSRSGYAESPEAAETSRRIITAYEQGDYPEVVRIYGAQWKDREAKIIPENPSCLLSVCYSLIKTRNAYQAMPLLTFLSADDSDYSDEGQWLQLYAFLSLGNREEAIQTAQSIIDNKGSYAQQAEEVLNKLKEKRVW